MNDRYLCIMGSLILLSYIVYMVFGPAGDGVILASVVGALGLLAGIKIPDED